MSNSFDTTFVLGCVAALGATIMVGLAIREALRPGFGYLTIVMLFAAWILACGIAGWFFNASNVSNPFTTWYLACMYGFRSWGSTIILGIAGVLCFVGALVALSGTGTVTDDGHFTFTSYRDLIRGLNAAATAAPAVATGTTHHAPGGHATPPPAPATGAPVVTVATPVHHTP